MHEFMATYNAQFWPSKWTTGERWPQYGEIDIIDAINLTGNNQYDVYSDPGVHQNRSLLKQGLQPTALAA
ncbi:glycoside hydrolase family 16 protein [Athelia psychrophila]|uniref:Glycoside hydrolase family 16 protein n=1 Tax=Athelia psychrophila TaxID=1759441 RepID=A0A166D7B0_9AGAM|nr:glycoside hydrolase family 16 protein [Fibularhizoctonia sp. CBS 109695]